ACTHSGGSSPAGEPASGPGRSGPQARSLGAPALDPAAPAAALPPTVDACVSLYAFFLFLRAWHPPHARLLSTCRRDSLGCGTGLRRRPSTPSSEEQTLAMKIWMHQSVTFGAAGPQATR